MTSPSPFFSACKRKRVSPILFTAIKTKHVVAIKKLIRQDHAIVHELNGQLPALSYAVSLGKIKAATVILEDGVNVNVNLPDCRGRTALHWAAGLGDIDMVKLLLKYDADVHARAPRGQPPIFDAIPIHAYGVVQILLEHGASVTAPDGFGDPPLHRVAHTSSVDTMKVLYHHGANVHAKNRLGWTALHTVAGSNYWDGVPPAQFLIQKGADVNALTLNGQSPLALAVNARNRLMVDFLLRNGARVDNALLAYARSLGLYTIVSYLKSIMEKYNLEHEN